MTRYPNPRRSLLLSVAFGVLCSTAPALGEYPIAGTQPAQRLPGAPVITAYNKDAAWYTRALHGVEKPYPSSLGFLEDQGPWHTPFDQPGMTGPYDLRDWHSD